VESWSCLTRILPRLGTKFRVLGCWCCGASVVPIRLLLESDRGAFNPEEVAFVVNAFEIVLRTLKLVDREDPAVLMVAKITMEVAKKQGEVDPERLSNIVLKRLVS
jgi:hypothetical protein